MSTLGEEQARYRRAWAKLDRASAPCHPASRRRSSSLGYSSFWYHSPEEPSFMPEPTLKELLAVAMDAAYLAGRRTLAYFQTGVRPDIKADNTPVTIADREAEDVVRQRVKAAYPHHAILGEEAGETQGDADYKWIVDPIDGTKAFVAGVPLYSTLVGVEVKGKASVGVI